MFSTCNHWSQVSLPPVYGAILTAYNGERSRKAMSTMMSTATSENYENNDGDAFDDESDD